MKVDLSELRALEQAATPGEWVYRPCEYDDWGWVRGPEKESEIGRYRPIVANARNSDVTEEQQNEHRRAGTDPYGPNALLIVALRNAAPALLDAYAERDQLREQVDTLTGALAEAMVIIAKLSPEGVDGLRAFLTDHSEEGR